MGSQCNSPSTISCQMWPHPWRYRAPWGLGCARGVSGLNAARRNFVWLAKSVCQLLVGAGRVSGQEKIRQERPSAVLFIIALSLATFLPPWARILVHTWVITQSKAFVRAVLEEQECSQGFLGAKDVLGHCSAWGLRRHAAVRRVFTWQALACTERKRREKEIASAEVLFVVIHTESSMVAPVNSDIDFTLTVDVVDSRASPGQKGAHCWQMPKHYHPEKGEQEEMQGSPGIRTAQLTGHTTLSDVWERFGCRGSPKCVQGLKPWWFYPPLRVILLSYSSWPPPLLWVPNGETSRSPFPSFYLSTKRALQGLICIWAAVCMKVYTRQLSHQKS